MRTRLEFLVSGKEVEYCEWCDIEQPPSVSDEIEVGDFLSEKDFDELNELEKYWTGIGEVIMKILRKDKQGVYYSIIINCQD